MRVLVTGASGFVGRVLTEQLLSQGHEVVALAGREESKAHEHSRPRLKTIKVDLLATGDLRPIMRGIHAVVHLAGQAHVRSGSRRDGRELFWPLNVDATRRLADAASSTGVGRFVFISSIGVNGDESIRPFRETDTPNPHSHYAESKLAAEQVLASLDLDTVIIRPPLIVGPGSKGNLRLMAKAVRHGLPFPDVHPANCRSLAGVSSLSQFITTCIDHPRAANQLLLFSDKPAISTADLLRRIAKAQGRSARLVAVPKSVMAASANLVGMSSAMGAFWKTLEVSMDRSEELLGWTQRCSLDQEIWQAARFILD